jgi:hypothetical protein
MPFDPVHKRTEATVKGSGREAVLCGQGSSAGHSADGDQRRCEVKPASRKPSMILPDAASARWALPGPMRKANGSLSACCRCSIRRASRPRQPSQAPADGREDQDGHGRSNCHRPGNLETTRPGFQHPGCNALGDTKEEGVASRPRPSKRRTASRRSFPSTSFIIDVLQRAATSSA